MTSPQSALSASYSLQPRTTQAICLGDLLDLVEHQSDMLDALVVQFFQMKKERDQLAKRIDQLLENRLAEKFGVKEL